MLYQKIRPDNLEDFVGNSAVVDSLRKVVNKAKNNQPHSHAYLFTGTSGCGKTTLARILAKEFGCQSDNIFEKDIGQLRGIDNVREIAKDASTRSVFGGKKIYILDECHQMTSQAQNALLKILEDIPAYCYFVICTTEPQGLLKTIKTRCSDYEVTRLGRRDVKKLVTSIRDKEKLKVSDDVLEAISLTSSGIPREFVVALEKVIDMPEEEAFKLLVTGTSEDTSIFDLCNLLKISPQGRTNNWKKIFKEFKGLQGEPEGIRRSILAILTKVLERSENEKEIINISGVLDIFSKMTYNGRTDLYVMLAKACFGKLNEDN